MNTTRSYFDKVSVGYAKASDRFLWKKIRTREALAVSELLPKIGPGTSALDLGCGSGYYTDLLHHHRVLNLTCVDFSVNMLNQINNPVFTKIAADIEKFRSKAKYDIILCAGALEFTQMPESVLANVSSMLNPGGSFILLCPAKSVLGLIYSGYHFGHAIRIKLFDRDDLFALGDKVGLRLQSAEDVLPFSIVAKFTND